MAANADFTASGYSGARHSPQPSLQDTINRQILSFASSNISFSNATYSTSFMTDSTALPPEEVEHSLSMTIFFILVVVGLCILVVQILISTKLHYFPESIAVVFVGAAIGLVLQLVGNWRKEEAFPSTVFFLIILPPIIFESGYNLHKGNFFQNIGSILVFAIFGTILSATVIGAGVFVAGLAKIAYPLSLIESFAFGSLISAVDPVATLAIFSAIDVDPILYMLVFGESVLNDAVSIVLTTTVIKLVQPGAASGWAAVASFLANFCLTFASSAGIGIAFGLGSALIMKWVDLRRTPSLEVGMMLIFSYAPYCLAESLRLSGIMAILFAGIVMSHYTHLNLSPVTQITVQQTFRTVAFIGETLVFAYLGMAIFSFKHIVQPALVSWSLVLCLVGRALNIFPLSWLLNHFREHKITPKMQVIMWFSGLRGAIAFALSLHLDVKQEVRQVLVSTTLIIVLFSVLVFGGSTMPMLKCLNARSSSSSVLPSRTHQKGTRRRNAKSTKSLVTKVDREVTLSKTREMGETVDSEALSEMAETETESECTAKNLKGFNRIDVKYLLPFFTRRFTLKEVDEGRRQLVTLTDKWFKEVRSAPHSSSELSSQPIAQRKKSDSSTNNGYPLAAGGGGDSGADEASIPLTAFVSVNLDSLDPIHIDFEDEEVTAETAVLLPKSAARFNRADAGAHGHEQQLPTHKNKFVYKS